MSESPNTQHQETNIYKTRLQSGGIGLPQLCGYCAGAGMILEGFFGLPQVCPDCKGDGIERP